MAAVVAIATTSVFASTMIWTASQADHFSGQPINVSAAITPQSGFVSVKLSNLEINPISDGQNLSGFFFTLEGTYGNLSLASATGELITISKSGQITDVGVASLPAWTVAATALNGVTNIQLTMLGTAHATETIIGPATQSGNYTAANGSIAGSVHNPFVLGDATFVIAGSGLTPSAIVEAASFGFGTSPGDVIAGQFAVFGSGAAGLQTPEPATEALVFAGIGLLLILQNRCRGGRALKTIKRSRREE